MKVTLVHSTRHDDGSSLELTLVLEAEQAPMVGDYVTVDGDPPHTLQVVERDWPQDLGSLTLHLRDPDVSGPQTSQQKLDTLIRAGWSSARGNRVGPRE